MSVPKIGVRENLLVGREQRPVQVYQYSVRHIFSPCSVQIPPMPLPGALAGRYFPSALPFGAAGAYARILRVLSAIAAAARLKPRRAVRCMARAPLCNAYAKPRAAAETPPCAARLFRQAASAGPGPHGDAGALSSPTAASAHGAPAALSASSAFAGYRRRHAAARLCAIAARSRAPSAHWAPAAAPGSCPQPIAVCSVSALRYKSRAHPQAPAAETHRWFRSRSGLRRRAPACRSARR